MRTFDHSRLDLRDASVLVTGGTGSFGRAFCRTVIEQHQPRKLVIFSRDEMKQWEMSLEQPFKDNPRIRYFLGDVRDRDRLEMAMRGIDYVVHAAALKHVPKAEYNPFECIRTNVHGAENVATAALNAGVKRVIALSTDKAASPLNLYGASKLAMEKIFIAANNLSGHGHTRFSIVRYGNVLGSRGSVLPLFQSLIAQGSDHLPITDQRMTRFWITLPQGVAFVLSCIDMMHGGEIFVPKISSMHVVDLARQLAPNLKIKEVGIRPGEKLHEVMVTADESRSALELSDRYVIEPVFIFWDRAPYIDDGARPVPDGFVYSSDNNSEWVSDADFKEMVGGVK